MPDPALRPYDPLTDAAFVVEISCRTRMPVDEHGVVRLLWRDWRFAYGHLVESWLRDGAAVVLDAGDSTYLGFAIMHDVQIKMVYVKPDFRGHGFGLKMIDALGTRSPYCPTASWRAWERTWHRPHD